MTLVEAIDKAVDYVREHPDQMTREEVEGFGRLAERVYTLSFRAGLTGALPRVGEMRPELESQDPPLPPVQFVSKLNLPGDWATVPLPWPQEDDRPLPSSYELHEGSPSSRVFMVCASPRWLHDMDVLRGLAENVSNSKPEAGATPEADKRGRPKKGKQVSTHLLLLDYYNAHPESKLWSGRKLENA